MNWKFTFFVALVLMIGMAFQTIPQISTGDIPLPEWMPPPNCNNGYTSGTAAYLACIQHELELGFDPPDCSICLLECMNACRSYRETCGWENMPILTYPYGDCRQACLEQTNLCYEIYH